MIRVSPIATTLLVLAIFVPVVRCQQIEKPFLVGIAIDDSFPREPECTLDELNLIKASAADSIAKRANKFFAAPEGDLHLDGDFLDITENMLVAGGRRLQGAWWKYSFVYGGMNTWTCKFCIKEAFDARKRNLRKGFSAKGLQHALSRRLNNDIRKDYAEWLDEHGLEFGCLGDGKNVAAVFELI